MYEQSEDERERKIKLDTLNMDFTKLILKNCQPKEKKSNGKILRKKTKEQNVYTRIIYVPGMRFRFRPNKKSKENT